jgi:hypothetical protein
MYTYNRDTRIRTFRLIHWHKLEKVYTRTNKLGHKLGYKLTKQGHKFEHKLTDQGHNKPVINYRSYTVLYVKVTVIQ